MHPNGLEPHLETYGTHSTSHHTTSSGAGSQAISSNIPHNQKSQAHSSSAAAAAALQNASLSSFQNLNAATSSLAIRSEIGRFEGMHPKIFEIYDLLDRIEIKMNNKLSTNSSSLIQEQDLNPNVIHDSEIQSDLDSIRENMISVEDFFVRSPEWTQPSQVLTSQIRLAVIGSMNSGKSALVHHYSA